MNKFEMMLYSIHILIYGLLKYDKINFQYYLYFFIQLSFLKFKTPKNLLRISYYKFLQFQ